MNELLSAGVSIALAIVGVALLAVLVSRNANTSGVLTAAGNAFSGALAVAEGPVSGNAPFHVGNSMTGPGFYQ